MQPADHRVGNNGASVDFGVLTTSSAKTGTIAKQVPFDIKATLSGGECAGQSLQASFSSTNADPSDNTQILPTTKPGVAIFLTQQRDTNKTDPANQRGFRRRAAG